MAIASDDEGEPSAPSSSASPASSTPSREPSPSRPPPRRNARLGELGLGVAWLVGLAAALTLIDAVLREAPLARLVLGALIASVAVSRAHVVWDRDDPEDASMKRPVLLALRGAAPAFAAVVAVCGVSIVFGFVTIESASPDVGTLIGLLGAGAMAMRDELLYRALPLHFARRAAVPRAFAVAFASLIGAIPLLASRGTDLAHVAVTVAVGALAAITMSSTRSVWAGIGAHLAFWSAWGPLSQAAFVHLHWKIGGVGATHSEGAPAWLGAAIVALVTVVVWSRAKEPKASSAPMA